MSQPPKTISLSPLSGTNSLICGERPSVRLPRRIVPSCVSEPTGCDLPLRTSSTPAIKVVLTAPMPGVRIPSFPLGGAIFPGFSMQLLNHKDLHTITQVVDGNPLHKQTSNDERSQNDLQIGAGRAPEFSRSASRVGRRKLAR